MRVCFGIALLCFVVGWQNSNHGVCFGIALLRFVIGCQNSNQFVNQWEAKTKPIVSYSRGD